MNIDNHYRSAEVYLEMSRQKFDSKDYGTSIASLVKSYEHIRQLIQQVYALMISSDQKLPVETEIAP